jgi:retinol dehydrogenase 14
LSSVRHARHSTSPAAAAETTVYLASSPEVDGVTGVYFADRMPKRANKLAYDATTTARLWQVSEELSHLSHQDEEPR